MKRVPQLFAALFVLCMATAAFAQSKTVDGKWDLMAETPHGKLTVEMDLKQSGADVTGTFVNFRGDRQPVKGQFKDGELTLQTVSGDEAAFSAKQKADGTLSGHASFAQGDIAFTASPAKKTR